MFNHPDKFDLIVELIRDVKVSSSKTVFQGGRFLGELIGGGRFRAVYHVVDFRTVGIEPKTGTDYIKLDEDLTFEPADYQAEFKKKREAKTGQSINPAHSPVTTNL